jgi:hypothetical protein
VLLNFSTFEGDGKSSGDGSQLKVKFCVPLPVMYVWDPTKLYVCPPSLLVHARTSKLVSEFEFTVIFNVQLNPHGPVLLPVLSEVASGLSRLTYVAGDAIVMLSHLETLVEFSVEVTLMQKV